MVLLPALPHDNTIAPALRLPELIDQFISSRDIKKNSKDLYKRTLGFFFSWADSKGYLLSEITMPHIIEYKEEKLAKGYSALTVSSYLNTVRDFYEFTEANRYYPNVAKGVRSPKRKQQFKKQPLQPSQATALLNYYQDKALRDYAIVSLLLRTGLRTIEVIRANVGDITYKGSQRVLLVQGKGRDEKDNFVILTDKAYQPIAEYLAARGKVSGSEPLFISTSNNSKGDRLTTRTISYIAKEGLKAIGLNEKAYTAHSLRHTAGTTLLRATNDLEQTRLMLRHSNPATTLIYVDTLNEDRRLENSGEAILDTIF